MEIFSKYEEQQFAKPYNIEDLIKGYLNQRTKELEIKRIVNPTGMTVNDLRSLKSSIFIDPMKNMQYLVIELFAKKVHNCFVEI